MSFILNPYRFISIVPPAPFPNTYSTELDGVDDYVILSLDGSTTGGILATADTDVNLTISLWVKLSTSVATQGILSWAASLNNGTPLIIIQQNSLDIRVYVDSTYQTATTIVLDTWYNIVVIRDSTTNIWTGYIDGSSFFTYDDSGSFSGRHNANDIYLGNGYNGYIAGNIDEVSIYDEVKAIGDLWDGTGKPTNLASESGLIAWYRMGDSAVFNANSQWEFPEQTKINNWSSHSFEFDGSDDYIDVGVLPYLNGASTFSISMWVNADSLPAGDQVFFAVVTDANHRIWIEFNSTNIIVGVGNGSNAYENLATGFSTSTWYHIAVVFDGGETGVDRVTLYVDGVAKTTTYLSFPATTATFTTSTFIGSYDSGLYPFNGMIDGVSVWDEALTSANVTSIFNTGVPTDLSTYSTKSFEFDGVDDVIQLDSAFATSGTDWSISFWWKSTQTGGNHYMVGQAGNPLFGLNWNRMYYSSSDNSFDITSVATANDGVWHHGVFTYNYTSGAWKFYIDGSLDTSQTATTGRDIPPFNFFGARKTTQYFYAGNLDEISYFSTELTSVQVSAFYNSGKPTNLSAETGLVGYWRMGEDAIYNGATTEFSLPDNSTNSNSGTSANMNFVDLKTDAPLSPVGYWRMGEGADWNGTEWQVPDYSRKALFSQQSFEFDGINQYQNYGDLGNVVDGKSKLSISMWNRLGSLSHNRTTGKMKDGNNWLGFGWAMDAGNYVAPYFVVSNGGLAYGQGGGGLGNTWKSPNIWYHVVCVFDGTLTGDANRCKIYVDGVLQVLSFPYTGIPATTYDFNSASYPWYIGADGFGFGTNNYEGLMDDYAIYGEALTQTQVNTVFNSGKPSDLSTYSKKSFYFDGIDSELFIPDIFTGNISAGTGREATISFWFAQKGGVGIYDGIVGMSSIYDESHISLNIYDRVQFSAGSGVVFKQWDKIDGTVTPNINALDGNWHHWCMCFPPDATYGYDLPNVKLFIDGTEIGQQSLGGVGGIGRVWSSPRIGHAGNYGFTKGNIDEFAIWFTDETANVLEIYGGSSGTGNGKTVDLNNLATAPAPTLWYRMGEDAVYDGSVPEFNVPDNSTNSNAGTTVSMDLTTLQEDAPFSPIAYYRMGENSTFNDDRDWEIPNYQKINNFSSHSFEFDGINQRVDFGSTVNLGSTSSESIWIKQATPTVGEVVVGTDWSTAPAGNSYHINLDGGGHAGRCYIRIGAYYFAFDDAATKSAINTTDWIHLAIIRTGADTMRLYVNGVDNDGEINSANGPASGDIEIDTLGMQHNGGYQFQGLIDEYAVFANTVLTAGNVNSIFNSGVPNDVRELSIGGLAGYWRMGEGATWVTSSSRWSIPDDSTNSNNGTGLGMDESAKVNNAPGNIEQGLSNAMDQIDRKFLSPGNEASGQGASTDVTDVINNAPDNENQGVSSGTPSPDIVEDVPV